jgi:hypothetical protein
MQYDQLICMRLAAALAHHQMARRRTVATCSGLALAFAVEGMAALMGSLKRDVVTGVFTVLAILGTAALAPSVIRLRRAERHVRQVLVVPLPPEPSKRAMTRARGPRERSRFGT